MYHTALASFCTAIWLLISVTPAGNNWQLQLRHPSLLNPLLSTPQIHLWLILFSRISEKLLGEIRRCVLTKEPSLRVWEVNRRGRAAPVLEPHPDTRGSTPGSGQRQLWS